MDISVNDNNMDISVNDNNMEISVNDNNMDNSVNDNNMNMEDHLVNLPKKGLKTRPYNIGMEKRA